MITMLEPFETITRKISGATYPTLSLLVPYMHILKNNFAPNEQNHETFDTYLNLIYGEDEDSDVISDDDYIPSGGSRQYWQYSHRQFHQKRRENIQSQVQVRGQGRGRGQGRRRGQGHGRGSIPTSYSTERDVDDMNTVEYLQPVNTEGLLQKVRAAIFLSLDELWLVPSNIALIATFLDPRFKTFDWCKGDSKDEAEKLVRELYNRAKSDLPPIISNTSDPLPSDDDDDIFKVLKGNTRNTEDEAEAADELVLYLQKKQIRLKDDPL